MDKFSSKTATNNGGSPIDKWILNNLIKIKESNSGPLITAFNLDGKKSNIPMNKVGILFNECSFMREGTSKNYGNGGSNCTTGNPIKFVDLTNVFPAVFINSQEGILKSTKNAYILPLCDLYKYPQMLNMMNEAYAEFIAQRKGNIKHDITHIANGMSSGCAAIVYYLSKELSLNGTKPDEERIVFLVEALHAISISMHNVAKYDESINKLFRMLPYVSDTADVLQSIMMMFMFDEMPTKSIRLNWVASVFRRFFKYEGNECFVKNPVGIIAVLLVAPMISELINSKLETKELINIIVRTINEAIQSIAKSLSETSITDINEINEIILDAFAKATKVKIIPIDMIIGVYRAVLAKEENISLALKISTHPEYVNITNKYTISNVQLKNTPICIKLDEDNSSTFIASNPKEWCGITLVNGKYIINVESMGISKFSVGSTVGQDNVANYRMTMINNNEGDILKGKYMGISSALMYFDPITSKFINRQHSIKFNPDIEFEICSNINGYTIKQNDKLVFDIKNNKDLTANILFCFKFCKVNIKLLELIDNKVASIESCQSLNEVFNNLKISSTPIAWGTNIVNKLKEES